MIPFQSITQACKTTGLSQHYLRENCKAGTIPHIMSGNKYLINVPALLQQMGVNLAAVEDNRPEKK